MQTTRCSFLKITLYTCIISIIILVPIAANWASHLTRHDINTLKMWIKLAIDGYAEPLRVEQPDEKSWWQMYSIVKE